MTGRSVPSPLDGVRLALASLSGVSDAAWARAGAPAADLAFLGGIALDETTREAARAMVDRGREEFLPPDPLAFVEAQLDALADAPLVPAVNVRSATLAPIRDASSLAAAHGAVLEVNAHCRQAEMCAVGCGESLLRDTDRLCDAVAAAAGAGATETGTGATDTGAGATETATGATVSVKVRAEVDGVDLAETARRVEAAGADAIHVDAMDTEEAVGEVREASSLFLVANNGVRGRESVSEYLAHGADAVSVGRPSDDPEVLGRVRRAVDELADRDWAAGDPPGRRRGRP